MYLFTGFVLYYFLCLPCWDPLGALPQLLSTWKLIQISRTMRMGRRLTIWSRPVGGGRKWPGQAAQKSSGAYPSSACAAGHLRQKRA
jgi:hypothetical protein